MKLLNTNKNEVKSVLKMKIRSPSVILSDINRTVGIGIKARLRIWGDLIVDPLIISNRLHQI